MNSMKLVKFYDRNILIPQTSANAPNEPGIEHNLIVLGPKNDVYQTTSSYQNRQMRETEKNYMTNPYLYNCCKRDLTPKHGQLV